MSRSLLLELVLASCLATAARAQSALYTIQEPNYFGNGIAVIGDIDGDGHPEYAVSGAVNGTTAFVSLRSGADGHLLRSWSGTFNLQFMPDVAGPGDVDSDGVPDVLVGWPAELIIGVGSLAGRTIVYSGATGAQIHAVNGTGFNTHCGRDVFAVGDQDGDGHAEFGLFNGGAMQVYSGATGLLRYTFATVDSFLDLRQDVVALGDVSGDGVPDFALGYIYAPGVVVYSGQDGSVVRSIAGPQSSFGWKLANAGDFDHDGVADLLVSAPEWNGSQGYIYVVSPLTGAILRTFTALTGGDRLGYGLAGGGDIDGDGMPDVLAVGRDDSTGLPWPKYVVAFSGANGSILALFSIDVQFPTVSSHFATAFLGDLDGDGKDEFCVGMLSGSSGITRVRVFRGAAPYGAPGTSTCEGDGSMGPCPCGNLGASGAGCANSTGAGGRLFGLGSTSMAANELAFAADQLPPNTVAVLFAGAPIAPAIFGDGLRCAAAGPRLGVGVAQSTGTRAWSLHPQSIPGLVAGSSRTFQAIFRNPLGTVCLTGKNLTNARTITFAP